MSQLNRKESKTITIVPIEKSELYVNNDNNINNNQKSVNGNVNNINNNNNTNRKNTRNTNDSRNNSIKIDPNTVSNLPQRINTNNCNGQLPESNQNNQNTSHQEFDINKSPISIRNDGDKNEISDDLIKAVKNKEDGTANIVENHQLFNNISKTNNKTKSNNKGEGLGDNGDHPFESSNNTISDELLKSKRNIQSLEAGYEELKNKVEELNNILKQKELQDQKNKGINEKKLNPRYFLINNVEPSFDFSYDKEMIKNNKETYRGGKESIRENKETTNRGIESIREKESYRVKDSIREKGRETSRGKVKETKEAKEKKDVRDSSREKGKESSREKISKEPSPRKKDKSSTEHLKDINNLRDNLEDAEAKRENSIEKKIEKLKHDTMNFNINLIEKENNLDKIQKLKLMVRVL